MNQGIDYNREKHLNDDRGVLRALCNAYEFAHVRVSSTRQGNLSSLIVSFFAVDRSENAFKLRVRRG